MGSHCHRHFCTFLKGDIFQVKEVLLSSWTNRDWIISHWCDQLIFSRKHSPFVALTEMPKVHYKESPQIISFFSFYYSLFTRSLFYFSSSLWFKNFYWMHKRAKIQPLLGIETCHPAGSFYYKNSYLGRWFTVKNKISVSCDLPRCFSHRLIRTQRMEFRVGLIPKSGHSLTESLNKADWKTEL